MTYQKQTRVRFLILLIICLFILISAVHAAGDEVIIHNHYTEGQAFHMVEQSDLWMDVTGIPMFKNLHMSFATGYVFQVDRILADGTVNARFIIHSIHIAMPELLGIQNFYDSTNPFSLPTQSTMYYGLVAGSEFAVDLDSDGNLSNVELSDIDMQRIAKQMSLRGREKEKLVEAVNDAFKELLSNQNDDIIDIAKEKPFKIGETWSKTIDNKEKTLKLTMEVSYTLKSHHDGIATFTLDAKVLKVKDKTFETSFQIKKFEGNLTGTVEVLEESGWINRSDMKLKFMGEMKKKDSDAAGDTDDKPITLNLTGAFQVKRIE